jgi:hypothetical protein
MSTSNPAWEDAASQPGQRLSRIVSREWDSQTRQQDVVFNLALLAVPERRTVRRCNRLDVVVAFRIVNQEIRTKCKRLATRRPTLRQVWELARRIKDQRDLVQQIDGSRALKHIWRLTRQNIRLRNRLVQIAKLWGLDASVLVFE